MVVLMRSSVVVQLCQVMPGLYEVIICHAPVPVIVHNGCNIASHGGEVVSISRLQPTCAEQGVNCLQAAWTCSTFARELTCTKHC